MSYLTIEEINSNPKYAPLDEEMWFFNRIQKEIHEIVKNLDITKKITRKTIGVYYKSIESLLNPYFLENDGDDGQVYFEPNYRTGTNLEFFASWNQYPTNWKTRGCHYHRRNLKNALLNCFEEYYCDWF
tara:strand:- start:2026 stop:2412 length:387 start_codon:yes stop_codon:yes gene_type:complete